MLAHSATFCSPTFYDMAELALDSDVPTVMSTLNPPSIPIEPGAPSTSIVSVECVEEPRDDAPAATPPFSPPSAPFSPLSDGGGYARRWAPCACPCDLLCYELLEIIFELRLLEDSAGWIASPSATPPCAGTLGLSLVCRGWRDALKSQRLWRLLHRRCFVSPCRGPDHRLTFARCAASRLYRWGTPDGLVEPPSGKQQAPVALSVCGAGVRQAVRFGSGCGRCCCWWWWCRWLRWCSSCSR